jgi:peptidoglycan/xylan/chitin deacetylase (PgdA/CDA1 family)
MSGLAAGSILLPELAISGSPVGAGPPAAAGALVLSITSFAVSLRLHRPSSLIAIVAIAVVGIEAWALRIASSPGAGLATAPLLGACAGVMVPKDAGWRAGVGAGVAALVLIFVRFEISREACMVMAAVLSLPALVVSLEVGLPRVSIATAGATFALAVPAAVVFAFLGATTPSANWFGAAISHGPRSGNEVALTFDDGPDASYTLQVASMLDKYGVKGTFFMVGKALAQRPDIARQLLNDGHVLGDHSYHHDATSWLRPDYPEIGETQGVFSRDLGVCPALFRPPHGTRTPFMAHKASSAGMKMITWDVSAADWATKDGQLVAERILSKAKPGSIILLHDGLDGRLSAARSVLLTALPLILDGLEARGLKPVTVPELLGIPATTPCMS